MEEKVLLFEQPELQSCSGHQTRAEKAQWSSVGQHRAGKHQEGP